MADKPYRSVLGGALYLSTRTLPGISTATYILGKFQDEPAQDHWRMIQHLSRYLKGTSDFGIYLPSGSGNIKFEAWTDSDWARDKTKRRSLSEFSITINGGTVIWRSQIQKYTAQ